MKALIVIEAIVLAIILVVAWISLSHDHEGEWMDSGTGEIFMIVPTADPALWTVTGASQSFSIARDTSQISNEYARFVVAVRGEAPRVGEYDRIRGQITWRAASLISATSVWLRLSDGRGLAPLSWLRARTLVRSWTLDGKWAGNTKSGALVMLQISTRPESPTVQADFRSGSMTTAMTGTMAKTDTLSDALDVSFTNPIGETFRFAWDGRARATFMYHNEPLVMRRLD